MRIGSLPGLLAALLLSALAAVSVQPSGVSATVGQADPALFSVAAQATATATTATTGTATVERVVTTTATSTEVVTSTGALTATATVTAPVSTPVPVPTVGPQAGLQINPFDWEFLTSPPTEAESWPVKGLGPFALAAAILMLALLGASIYFYFIRRPVWKRTNSVLYRAAHRWGQVGLWLSIVGLLLVLARLVSLDFFNVRMWLYLWGLALLISVGWFIYWYRTVYPQQLAKYEKRQRARQYGAGPSRGPSRPVTAQSGRGFRRPGTAEPADRAATRKPGTATAPAAGATATSTGAQRNTAGSTTPKQGAKRRKRR